MMKIYASNSIPQFGSFSDVVIRNVWSFLPRLTTIYESPNNIKFFMSISNAFLSPCISTSYLVMLLLHSNYNRQVIKVLLPVGLMSTQPTPTPFLDLEQSKYKDQICASSVVLGILGKAGV
jgi:hypothetical protein